MGFNCVEINSSFYRPHRRGTYERWAASTPPDFSFSVKVPKRISHELRLTDCADELERFVHEVDGLGPKLGPILLQLPPSLAFAPKHESFLAQLRDCLPGFIVCEPRHASWFTEDAEQALRAFGIGRAAVDPAVVPAAATPGGSDTIAYVRLHGSPRMYWSSYDDEALLHWLAAARHHPARERWIVFDNTAAGAAWGDAVRMQTFADVGARSGHR